MNAPVKASPLPLPGPAEPADPVDGRRAACHAEVGRLGDDFERLLRDRADACREQEPGDRRRHEKTGSDGGPCDPPPAHAVPANTACTSLYDATQAPRPWRAAGSKHGSAEAEGAEGAGAANGSARTVQGRALEAASPAAAGTHRPAAPGGYVWRRGYGGHDGEVGEPARNDAAHASELAVRWAATPGATRPSALTSNPAPDPREMGATRAALEASLMNPVPTPDAHAAAWEVSLPLACGAALELQATRPQGSAGAAAWNLGIRSGARDLASALARTAPRLSERLESRAVPVHLRIERDDPKDAA